MLSLYLVMNNVNITNVMYCKNLEWNGLFRASLCVTFCWNIPVLNFPFLDMIHFGMFLRV